MVDTIYKEQKMKNWLKRWLIKKIFTADERYEIWSGMTMHTSRMMDIDFELGKKSNELRELFMKMELREGVTPDQALKALGELKSEIELVSLTMPENLRNN